MPVPACVVRGGGFRERVPGAAVAAVTVVLARIPRLLAAVVAGGLLAMHGAPGTHGSSGMGRPSGFSTAASMSSPAESAAMDTLNLADKAAAAGHVRDHAGQMCLALPVFLVPLLALAATTVRRRQRDVRAAGWRRVRAARAPPCPPPQVRGVCLT